MNFLLGKSPGNRASFVVTGVPLATEGEQQQPEEYQHLPSRISNSNPLVEPVKPEEPFLSRESGTQADSKIFTNDIMQHIVVDPPVVQSKVHVYTLPGRHQHLLSPQNEPRGFKGVAHKLAGTPQANAAMMLMASTTNNKFQHTLKVRAPHDNLCQYEELVSQYDSSKKHLLARSTNLRHNSPKRTSAGAAHFPGLPGLSQSGTFARQKA